MKNKKIKPLIYGTVSTLAVIAPVAAVVSCGETSTTTTKTENGSTTSPTTNPSNGSTTSPTTNPSNGSTTSPSDGSTTNPSNGSTTTPSDGSTTSPSNGSTTSPSNGSTTNPTTNPSNGPTSNPNNGSNTSPSDGSATTPSDGSSNNPASPSTGPTQPAQPAQAYAFHADGKYTLDSLVNESKRYNDASEWGGGMEYHAINSTMSLLRAMAEKYGYSTAADTNGKTQLEKDLPAAKTLIAPAPAQIYVQSSGKVLGSPTAAQNKVIKALKTFTQTSEKITQDIHFATLGDDGALSFDKLSAFNIGSANALSASNSDIKVDTKNDADMANALSFDWYSTYDDANDPSVTKIIMHESKSNVILEMSLKGVKTSYPLIAKDEFKTNVSPFIVKALESFATFYNANKPLLDLALSGMLGSNVNLKDQTPFKEAEYLIGKVTANGKVVIDDTFIKYLSELNDQGVIHWTAVKAFYYGFDKSVASGLMAPFAVVNGGDWNYASNLPGLKDISNPLDLAKWAHYNSFAKYETDAEMPEVKINTNFTMLKGRRLTYVGNLSIEDNLKAAGYTDADIKLLKTYTDWRDGKNVSPSEGTTTQPGDTTTNPGNGTTTQPGDGTTTQPGDGTTTQPGDGTTTQPGDTTTNPGNGTTTQPGDTTTNPGNGTTTQPGDGTTTQPGDTTTSPGNGTTTQPGGGTTTQPSEGTTTQPSDGTTTNPGSGSTTNPVDGSTTQPGGGATTQPSEGTTTQPNEGTTTNPGNGTTTQPSDETTTPTEPKVDPLVKYPFHADGKFSAQSLSDESKRYEDNARWVGGLEYHSVVSTISLLRVMAEKYGYTSDLDASGKSQREKDQSGNIFILSDGKVLGTPSAAQTKVVNAFKSFKQSGQPITKPINFAALGDDKDLTFEKLVTLNIISDYTISKDGEYAIKLNNGGDASIASSMLIDWFSMYDDETDPEVMNIEMHEKNTNVTYEMALRGIKDKYPVIQKDEFKTNVIPYIKKALTAFADLYKNDKSSVNIALNGFLFIEPILRDGQVFKQLDFLLGKLNVSGKLTLDETFDKYLSELNESGTIHWTPVKALYFGFDKSVTTGLMAPFSVVGDDWNYKQELNGLKDISGFLDFQKWDHYTYFVKHETGSSYAFVPDNTNFSTLHGPRIGYIGNLSLVDSLKANGYTDADVTMLKKYINLREGRVVDYEDPAWTNGSASTQPAQPGNGTTTQPSDGSTTNPGNGTTTPADGSTTNPGNGTTTQPSDGSTTNPGNGTTTPADGSTTNPGNGTTTPVDGSTTNPGDGTTTPADGSTTNPGDKPSTDPVAEPLTPVATQVQYPVHTQEKYSLQSLTDESKRYSDDSHWVGGMEYHSYMSMVSLIRALSEKYGYTSEKDANGKSQREKDLPAAVDNWFSSDEPAGIFVLADGTVLGTPNSDQAKVIKAMKTLKQANGPFSTPIAYSAYGDDEDLTYEKFESLHIVSDNTISKNGSYSISFDTKGDSTMAKSVLINWYSMYDDPENPGITKIIMQDKDTKVVFEMALKGLKDKYPVIEKQEFKTNVEPSIKQAVESFLNFYNSKSSDFDTALNGSLNGWWTFNIVHRDYTVYKQFSYLINKLTVDGKLTFDDKFDSYLSELNDKGAIHWTAVKAMYFGFDNSVSTGLMAPYSVVGSSWAYNNPLNGLKDLSSFDDYRKWSHYNNFTKIESGDAISVIPNNTAFASLKGPRIAFVGTLSLEENLKAAGYSDEDIQWLKTYTDWKSK